MNANLQNKPTMVFRSVIRGSNGAFFIHLPKLWLARHDIKKGDRLMVTGLNRLTIHPPERLERADD